MAPAGPAPAPAGKGSDMSTCKRTAALALLLCLAVAAVAPADAAKRPWESFKLADLGEIKIPAYTRTELANGMVVYLCEDHEFPLIELSATIRVGGIYEPADKVGLAEITGAVMRTGGTATWSGDEIDERLEAIGAVVETYIGQSEGGAYLSALTQDLDTGLAVLAEVLRRPRFDPDKVDLAKKEQTAGIARRNDEPMEIARREFARIIYGADHPLGRVPEYDGINAITRDDLVAFHAEFFHPDRVYLVAIGDFESAGLLEKLEQAFGDWPRATRKLPADPEMPDFPRTVNVVDKGDLTQSTVILGHLGIRADDPHYPGLIVANRILGAGFSSRLFNEVRSKRGYAYATGSAPGTGFRFPGVFTAFVGTKSSTTEDATRVILDQIELMTTQPVSAAELRLAKDAILNADVFNFDTKRKVLDRQVMYEMYGYPPDFLQRYREAVRGMTADQVLVATRAVWRPERMSILAVGNPADWDGDLSIFGPVNLVDITIPEPTPRLEIPAATPEALARGQELMAKASAAVGGKALAGLKGQRRSLTLELEIQGMALSFGIEETSFYPDRMRMVQRTPFGEMTQVLDGERGWAISPMGKKDMDAAELAEARKGMQADLLRILRDHKQLTCQALSPDQLEGAPCERVYVTGAGDKHVLLFLDPQSGLPLAEESPGRSPVTGGPVTQRTLYHDYDGFGALKLARRLTILHDGQPFASGKLDAFELNPKLDESLFKRD